MKVVIILSLLCSTAGANYSELIRKEAVRQRVEPEVAIAVAKVESNLNPKAVGSKGEIGLFQLRPEFHRGNLLDPKTNIKLGVAHLAYWKRKCPVQDKLAWFTCFNQGSRKPKYPTILPYYRKVAREINEQRLLR